MANILDLTDGHYDADRPYTRKDNVRFAVILLATVTFGTLSLGWVALIN